MNVLTTGLKMEMESMYDSVSSEYLRPRGNVLNYVGTLKASIYALLRKSYAHKTLTSTQENSRALPCSLSSVSR